jgi:hypothetical protein
MMIVSDIAVTAASKWAVRDDPLEMSLLVMLILSLLEMSLLLRGWIADKDDEGDDNDDDVAEIIAD